MGVKLSVIVPSHNRPDLLRLCLASVLRHAAPATEVIVVDDGSPNRGVTAAAGAFPGVGVVGWDEGRGFCAAVNAGVRAARHPVVEVLNDDTEVTAGWAAAALSWFDESWVGAVAPLVLCRPAGADGVRIDSAGDRYYLGGVAAKRGHGRPLHEAFLRPCEVFGASASSAFYRREALLQIHGFPEEFGAYFEDVDVAFRLHRAGWRVAYEPGSVVYHRGGASHGPPAGELLERQSRNEERLFWRNVPGRDLGRALPLHLAVLLGKAWRRWREGNLRPWLRGRLRLLGEIGAIRRHRQWLARQGPPVSAVYWGVESRFWGHTGERSSWKPKARCSNR